MLRGKYGTQFWSHPEGGGILFLEMSCNICPDNYVTILKGSVSNLLNCLYFHFIFQDS